MRRVLLAAVGFLLGAAAPAETIVYSYRSVGLCLHCPTYSITVAPDGAGQFTGKRDVAALGPHPFHATPQEVHAFTDRLREYRPTGEVLMEDERFCRSMWTDQDWIDIVWEAPGKPRRHLSFYRGCDPEKNAKMDKRLATAPRLLPIEPFIGTTR